MGVVFGLGRRRVYMGAPFSHAGFAGLASGRLYTAPMTVVTTKEAKDRLGELLAEAAKGEEVVIAGEDGATFKLVPAETPPRKKRGGLGIAKGEIWMAEDFDAIPEGFEEYLP